MASAELSRRVGKNAAILRGLDRTLQALEAVEKALPPRELAEFAARVTGLIGPDRAREYAAQLRRYAALTEARCAGTARVRTSSPSPAPRRGHVGGHARPAFSRCRATRAGPDPDLAEPPSRRRRSLA